MGRASCTCGAAWTTPSSTPPGLPPVLRDAVCEQCHLEGEARVLRAGRGLFDYRPGLPLSEFWAVLVRARQSGQDAKAVTHVEQMDQSKCFQRPVGTLQLGCITCHDPHVCVGPAERESHYRSRVPEMPRRDKGPARLFGGDGAARADQPARQLHRLPHAALRQFGRGSRGGDRPPHPAPAGRPSARAGRPTSTTPVSSNFYQDRFPEGRSAGRAHARSWAGEDVSAGMLSPQRRGEQALASLESALGPDPQDGEVRASKAQLLLLLGRHSEALAEARTALAKRPGDWRLLACAASAAQTEGQTDLAIDYWRQAVEINPLAPEHQLSLIGLLVRTGQLDEAEKHCAKLLQIDPFNVPGRQARVDFLLQQGKKAEARPRVRRHPPPPAAGPPAAGGVVPRRG